MSPSNRRPRRIIRSGQSRSMRSAGLHPDPYDYDRHGRMGGGHDDEPSVNSHLARRLAGFRWTSRATLKARQAVRGRDTLKECCQVVIELASLCRVKIRTVTGAANLPGVLEFARTGYDSIVRSNFCFRRIGCWQGHLPIGHFTARRDRAPTHSRYNSRGIAPDGSAM